MKQVQILMVNIYESLLHYLAHEYMGSRTLSGDGSIELAEILIGAGANIELVGYNNWRAIDILLDANDKIFSNVLIKYGCSA